MNDFAHLAEHHLLQHDDIGLVDLSLWLASVPCSPPSTRATSVPIKPDAPRPNSRTVRPSLGSPGSLTRELSTQAERMYSLRPVRTAVRTIRRQKMVNTGQR